MKHTGFLLKIAAACTILLMTSVSAFCQSLLDKLISVEAAKKPLGEVLKAMEKQGGFQFSYNTSIIKNDSLVSISVRKKPVRDVLNRLFSGRYEYKETGNYIILQKYAVGQPWYISGYVVDEKTGQRVPNASIYEPQQLVAALTNDQGYFRLKLKDRYAVSAINISKQWYDDKSIEVTPGSDQELTVSITPRVFELEAVEVTRYSRIESTWYGRLFISSKGRMQSMNLGKFFVDKPFQFSVIPGMGTHGKMASQVENKFSLNVLGGYTAAVNGLEIGTVFNIVKKDVQQVQIAGLFNVVGGHVNGVQVAGALNQVLDSVYGVQVGGLGSKVDGDFKGVQTGGFYNQVAGSMQGAQAAGFANYSGKSRGVQIAGFANVSHKELRGIQISGFLNYTRHLKGVQLGVVNMADTADGVSLGLFNIVRHNGYHKISIASNEVLNFNFAVKTGTPGFYTILQAGLNTVNTQKAYGFGWGMGRQFNLGKRLALGPELIAQQIYLSDWDHLNLLGKLQMNLDIRVNRYLMLSAGPSFNAYHSDQVTVEKDYKSSIPGSGYQTFSLGDKAIGWVGWNVAISFF